MEGGPKVQGAAREERRDREEEGGGGQAIGRPPSRLSVIDQAGNRAARGGGGFGSGVVDGYEGASLWGDWGGDLPGVDDRSRGVRGFARVFG